MNILMLLAALSLSAIAAFYSIVGLTAIFAAAVIPIIVMGSVLEVSKLVVASWVYRNWKEAPFLLKSYLSIAVVILMVITSMGIFGFLSKAHLDQAVPTGNLQAQLEVINDKIQIEKDNVNDARTTLAQLDKQVNETINRTADEFDDGGVQRSIQLRKSQGKERKKLLATIEKSQKEIAKLTIEKAPISTEVRKVEAEVGPIKYIAALIYGDKVDENLLEKAVRYVIILIVSVFDPLAVLMLVAFNWSLKHRKEKDPKPKGWHKELVPDSEEWPPYEPEFNEPKPNKQKKVKPLRPIIRRKWLEKDSDIIPTPPPPPPTQSSRSPSLEIFSDGQRAFKDKDTL